MTLYTGMAGSPITYLTTGMSETATTATVSDGTALPDAPNLCTIGFGENIETIRYGAKVGNSLSDITRGIEGVPQAWDVGTEVARFFTAYDHNELVAEITRLEQERVTHQADYAELLAGGTPYELTLINGWTGTLKVKRNKLKQLHIWGLITPGVTDPATDIIERIPAEYRVPIDDVSTIAIPAHTVNGSIIGLAYVGGRIRIYRPASDEVGTNQIRISYIIQGA